MKTGTFEVMEQNEMMAVSGGGKGHDAANTIASAGVFYASVISYNYNYTSRKPPKNSHHS